MSRRARQRRQRSRGSLGKAFVIPLVALVVIAGAGVGAVALWVSEVRSSAPSIDELKPIDRGAVSEVLAADGSRLGYIESDAIRDEVGIEEIPTSLRRATIAIEDENFYEHDGVDWGAVVRAAWENAEAGFEVRQGGSTITQQLVKNLYIPDPEETIERKIVEATLAEELERQHSKRWILQQYLNTASYGTNDGRTAIGVEAASEVYFDKQVSELNLREAALLAGLPQAPSQYNPFASPEQATRRRNQVLERMDEEGYITGAARQRAQAAGLGLERGRKYETIREPYFFDFVEQQLFERYGVNTVRHGGLRVQTTIDPRLQAIAQRAVTDGAARLGGPSAALVAVDVASGRILAMASTSSYDSAQYNLAAQGQRQPGSAFKPFVLVTALEQGIDPRTTYYDGTSPATLRPDPYSTWTVNNAEPGGGTMSVAEATTKSVNAVYAQLGLDVEPDEVAETARALGITSPLDGYPAEAIGGLRVGVSPLEMASAYATLASGGVRHRQTAIERVEFPPEEGEDAVETFEDPEGRRVLSDGVAYEATEILKTVVERGTATAARIGCPAAGKTGTTDDQTDAWFVGYTPRLSVAVWTGYPEARTSMGSDAFGGTYAAPIWRDFVVRARDGYCGDFREPEEPAQLSSFSSDLTVGTGSGGSSAPGRGSSSGATHDRRDRGGSGP